MASIMAAVRYNIPPLFRRANKLVCGPNLGSSLCSLSLSPSREIGRRLYSAILDLRSKTGSELRAPPSLFHPTPTHPPVTRPLCRYRECTLRPEYILQRYS